MKALTDSEFISIVNKCLTKAGAAKLVGMAFSSFKRRAINLGIYKKNQGGKGLIKKERNNHINTKDILAGKYPEYQTYKLHIRLIKEKYFDDKCSICGWDKIPENRKYTPCELDHIDGNPINHTLENLRLICPNCHSLTTTYRFRRGKINEARGRKLLDAMESNSVKPLDNGNAEPSLNRNILEGVET